MAINQPLATDTLDSPDHALSHRVFANDSSAPVQSVVVDASGNVGINKVVPVSGFDINKSIGFKVTAVTNTDHTADATETMIFVTASTVAVTITLPTAVGATGRFYVIKKVDATATYTVTVDGAGTETIDGELTQILRPYDAISIVSDGANWQII